MHHVAATHDGSSREEMHGGGDQIVILPYPDNVGVGHIGPHVRILHPHLARHTLCIDMIGKGVEVANGEIGGLGLVVFVKGERMVAHAQPRVAVRQVPEGDIIHHLAMLA